jgi:hypothetical protein
MVSCVKTTFWVAAFEASTRSTIGPSAARAWVAAAIRSAPANAAGARRSSEQVIAPNFKPTPQSSSDSLACSGCLHGASLTVPPPGVICSASRSSARGAHRMPAGDPVFTRGTVGRFHAVGLLRRRHRLFFPGGPARRGARGAKRGVPFKTVGSSKTTFFGETMP